MVNGTNHPIVDRSGPLLVTGSGGFLGKHLRAELLQHGYSNLQLPRRAEFDLRHENQVRQMFEELRPLRVIRLAGVRGGVETNQARPGEFFYDNLTMGAMLMEVHLI